MVSVKDMFNDENRQTRKHLADNFFISGRVHSMTNHHKDCPHKDQDGRPINLEALLTRVSEAVLTSIMALEACGVPRDRMEIIVGEDGGTVIVGDMIFQTPIENKLTKEEGRRLFNVFKNLLE
ncbi:MAG: hypothetical protein QG656_2200 [Candidatus Hydrogenedentes bacterium]|nr:hypothetical protein [Candidatus Hydrogenedentota bacterium]